MNLIIIVSKLLAKTFDKLQTQGKLAIDYLKILVSEPDRFRYWVKVAVYVCAEDC
jgi:hypothetical protein